MGSKREEERNEKIIRGLMKLPPNRRCINCNSLGPQYVCTNFWTFVCMPCSGIHREFTHRVKSVSMAKFTSQEVDALQKGGNQRARELFLNTWDPLRHKHPDNSNADKVREFIRNVYVKKIYAVDQSSDRPPKDPQSVRSREDEMRRASSYHSYSQSPPYDFQYEERRYGKPVASLTRKHGSDRGLYEGRMSSLSSPSRFSDHANDERFANEGSFPRVSDYSVSSGGDPFRSDVLSPSPQRGTWSPFNETSSNFSSEVNHTIPHLDANAGKISRPQRTASGGSFGSFDSMSFKSVNSTGLLDLATEAKQPVVTSPDATLSFPSPPQSSTSTTFNGLDLFNEPYAPQNFTSTPVTICSSQSPESLSGQSVDLFQQSPISSVPTLVVQQPAQTLQPALSQQQPVASLNNMPHNGGWATYDPSLNLTPMASQNSIPAPVPFSAGNNLGVYNQFSHDQSAYSQNTTSHEPSASRHTLWHDGLQNVEPKNNTQFWNAFEDPLQNQPIEYVLKDNQAAMRNTDRSFDVSHEALNYGGNMNNTYEIEPHPSSLSSHSNMALQNFSMVPQMAGVRPVLNVHTNPFDLPCDADFESNDMTQFWNMSSLQAALPNSHMPAAYIGGENESWFPQNSIPSYIPGGVPFDPLNGSLGFIVSQAPSAQISSVPAQGPVASVGGNPFA